MQLAEYNQLYQQSITDPEAFWGDQARRNIDWIHPWNQVLHFDWSHIGATTKPYVEWFKGAQLNISSNCLDRHITAGKGDKPAILWQGEDPQQRRQLTYQQLLDEVNRCANVLKKMGVHKGTVVTIFLPFIPELPIAMLACARIGAIHSVVFSAFSAEALKSRIQDCNSSIVITADVGFYKGKPVPLKDKVDQALLDCSTVQHVLVYNHGQHSVAMTAKRDWWWHEAMQQPDISDDCTPAVMEAEDPLFILYTSGSTGKPKGVLHTTAGYLVYANLTSRVIFDLQDDDVYWCTADCGWITGHTYVVYGPLSNAATVLLYEGYMTYPTADRWWQLVEEYKVTKFYTAPTAIRALMRLGADWPAQHDLSSLRVLGTVGEPINPAAWQWYYDVIGQKRCPVVDTWWQTETGGIMITAIPGAHSTKPGSATKPFFGVVPKVLRQDGTEAAVNEAGSLVLTQPWPSMIRGVYGDAQHALIKKTYFCQFPDNYFSGDGCRIDEDGYYWLTGRIDDVINVSGHRLSTAEIESALVADTTVAEAAVVGYPCDIRGQAIYCFVTLKQGLTPSIALRKQLKQQIRTMIGPIATPDKIQFAEALPKTRSGKIMRRILRKIAENNLDQIGDTSTLAEPDVVTTLVAGRLDSTDDNCQLPDR